jgi:hypothetical protein
MVGIPMTSHKGQVKDREMIVDSKNEALKNYRMGVRASAVF